MMGHGEHLKSTTIVFLTGLPQRNPYCPFAPYQQISVELLIPSLLTHLSRLLLCNLIRII